MTDGLLVYQRAIIPDGRAVHPLIRRLWAEIAAQRTSQETVAKRAGVSSSAMRKWRRGDRKPNLQDLDACFGALGLQLTVEEKPD